MIDKETVDRIFASANIVEVISDFVQLKKKGSITRHAVRSITKSRLRLLSRRRKAFSNVSAAGKAATPSPS